MTNLTVWVLLMRLLGCIILGLIGRAMSRRGILAVALGAPGLAVFFTVLSFLSMVGTTPTSACFCDQGYCTWENSVITVAVAPSTLDFALLADRSLRVFA